MRRIISLIVIAAFAFVLVACTGDKSPVDSEVNLSQVSSEAEVSSSTQSRVEIVNKLSQEQKQTVTEKISDAESLTDGIKLSEEQKLVPVILAQTNNISYVSITVNASGISEDVVEVAFCPEKSDTGEMKAVDVEGYQIGFVRIIYNAELSQIKDVEKSEDYAVIVNDEERYFISPGMVGTELKFHFYYKINEDAICMVIGNVDEANQLTEEFAQRMKEDFVCRPLSEL